MEDEFKILSDTEFLKFVNGNEKVFRKVFDRYHRVLYSYIFGFTKSHHDAEEILQDTFITLNENRDWFFPIMS